MSYLETKCLWTGLIPPPTHTHTPTHKLCLLQCIIVKRSGSARTTHPSNVRIENSHKFLKVWPSNQVCAWSKLTWSRKVEWCIQSVSSKLQTEINNYLILSSQLFHTVCHNLLYNWWSKVSSNWTLYHVGIQIWKKRNDNKTTYQDKVWLLTILRT